MGATNARMIDLRAFGLRSIEAPSLTASGPVVNRVLRFLAQLDPPRPRKSSVHEKSPRDNVPRASSPGLRRSSAPSALQTVCSTEQTEARSVAFDSLARSGHGETQMTTALARIPSSPLRLAFACAFMILVAISMIPR